MASSPTRILVLFFKTPLRIISAACAGDFFANRLNDSARSFLVLDSLFLGMNRDELTILVFTFILKARYKVLINERLQYSRSKSAWLINNDGVKPSFHSHQLINVELKDKNNNIRTVWKTLASEVDFSLNADEVVLSYMKSRH